MFVNHDRGDITAFTDNVHRNARSQEPCDVAAPNRMRCHVRGAFRHLIERLSRLTVFRVFPVRTVGAVDAWPGPLVDVLPNRRLRETPPAGRE